MDTLNPSRRPPNLFVSALWALFWLMAVLSTSAVGLCLARDILPLTWQVAVAWGLFPITTLLFSLRFLGLSRSRVSMWVQRLLRLGMRVWLLLGLFWSALVFVYAVLLLLSGSDLI